MKNLIVASLVLASSSLLSQANTDVFIMDIAVSNDVFNFARVKNISNNEGYDNQPSFWDDDTVIYARNKSGQTDIATYTISKKATKWFNDKTIGGEYSPQRIPGDIKMAAVRLDPNGRQRLYKYSADGSNSVIFNDLEVAYFAYHDKNRIIASILSSGSLELVIANVENGEILSYIENTGRSIHKMPNSAPVSYTTVNEEKNHDIYLLDIDEDGESFFVCQLPIGVEDYAWLDESKIICASGKKLYLYDLFGNGDWKEVADLTSNKVMDITRLAVSPNGKKLAFVAEPIVEAKVTEGYVEKAIKARDTETVKAITGEGKEEEAPRSLSKIKESVMARNNKAEVAPSETETDPVPVTTKPVKVVAEASKETVEKKADPEITLPKKEAPKEVIVADVPKVTEKKVIPVVSTPKNEVPKKVVATKVTPKEEKKAPETTLPKKEEPKEVIVADVPKVTEKKVTPVVSIPKNEVPKEVVATKVTPKEEKKVPEANLPKKEAPKEVVVADVPKVKEKKVTPVVSIPKNEVPKEVVATKVTPKVENKAKETSLPKKEESQKVIPKETVAAEKKKETPIKRIERPIIENAEAIVQKHIAPYNTKKYEDMVACFTENVVVRNFPNKVSYTGRKTMLEKYTEFASKNKGLWVLVDNRMSLKNVVVDEETALVSGKKYHQATIYEVNEKLITSMTFIHDNGDKKDPVSIVQKQLDAYNNRDIDAFMKTYAEDVELYNFPGQLRSKGQDAMKGGYAGFFKNTPDLHCEIENRIVVGNKVIDKEKVTANGRTFGAIAIYEVENGLISKVTFIQ